VSIITKYEHQTLRIGESGFSRKHLDAFIRLNAMHEGAYFDIIPNGVKFRQYVGVIQVGGYTIQIHPKVDDKSDYESSWCRVLVHMLRECGRVKINPYEDAHLKKGGMNLLELYFDQYLTEVQILIRNGLVKQYRKESGNVKALKGKLDFAQNIRHNLVHKERFYTTHQVYDVDHKIHQVLAQALEIVGQLSSSMWISDKCRRVQLHFPEFRKIQATKQLLDSINLNRKTAPYERALELARLIILNYSPDIAAGNERMISILFDMNKLWEEYVLVKLRKHIRENQKDYSGWTLRGQQSKLFWGRNSLRPDIVLTTPDDTYVIDTKWKNPDNSTSIQDLRQIYAYGRFWNAQKVMLLYPGATSGNTFVQFENEEYLKDNRTMHHECKKGVVSVLKEQDGKVVLNDWVGMNIFDQLFDHPPII